MITNVSETNGNYGESDLDFRICFLFLKDLYTSVQSVGSTFTGCTTAPGTVQHLPVSPGLNTPQDYCLNV